MTHELIFLKLGGSLITDKTTPRAARPEVLQRAADEIAQALAASPNLCLVVGHGSGSFGHIPAHQYATRQGVWTLQEWRGFVEVWKEAAALNHLVLQALHNAGLPAVALPASASLAAQDRQVLEWNTAPLRMALHAGLIPVIYGDVIFDRLLGGTIFSTEDLFAHLAGQLQPGSILLAGVEDGVWADYPSRTQLIPLITPQNFAQIAAGLGGSAGMDVTGGMASKVKEMLTLASRLPGLKIRIFSGLAEGSIRRALQGEALGTLICAEAQET